MEKKVNGNTQYTYTYSAANELALVKNPDGSTYLDFEYDENGNTLSETQTTNNQQQSTSFTYDNKNLLVKVVKPSGDIIEYVYDGNGNRYSKSINGEKRYYHYDIGGNIISETDESGGLLVKYVRDTDGQAISMIQGSNTYYFLYNAHGDVTSVTDSSGNVVASYAYDEFGNIKDYTEPQNFYNPLRYSGANNAYFDNETGLYKMGVRYYSAEIGRWITRDSFNGEQQKPLSLNKYVYVLNNPTIYFDSTGNKEEKWPKVKTVTTTATNYTSNKYGDGVFVSYKLTTKVTKYIKSGSRWHGNLWITSGLEGYNVVFPEDAKGWVYSSSAKADYRMDVLTIKGSVGKNKAGHVIYDRWLARAYEKKDAMKYEVTIYVEGKVVRGDNGHPESFSNWMKQKIKI